MIFRFRNPIVLHGELQITSAANNSGVKTLKRGIHGPKVRHKRPHYINIVMRFFLDFRVRDGDNSVTTAIVGMVSAAVKNEKMSKDLELST